jgi:hypothetical protein
MALADGTNARETSRVSGKYICDSLYSYNMVYQYYNITVTINDNLNKMLYHMSRKNFKNLSFVGE